MTYIRHVVICTYMSPSGDISGEVSLEHQPWSTSYHSWCTSADPKLSIGFQAYGHFVFSLIRL